MVLEPPRRELSNLIAQGIRKGELPPALETEFALALLLGPVLYQFIFRKQFVFANPMVLGDLPEKVVDAFWKAFQRSQIRAAAAVAVNRGHGLAS